MALPKTVQARVLVAFTYEETRYQPNQVAEFPVSVVAMLKAGGWIDDDKAAVAYCLKSAEA